MTQDKFSKEINLNKKLTKKYVDQSKVFTQNITQLNNIKNSKPFIWWQNYNVIKKIFINKKKLSKKVIKKISDYYYIYKKNPKKFKILKSIYESEKNTLTINKIDKHFLIVETNKKIDVIIPWYGDKNIFKLIPNILKSDYNHLSKIFIINDDYPDKELSNQLEKFIKKIKDKKIIFINQFENKGFVGTVNHGFSLIKNDCVILNSDVLTTKNLIKKILDVSESDQKIATITPLSNNATIFSVPKFLEKNEDDDYTLTGNICEKIYPQKTINVPTGHGFCMFIRKKYLDKYGIFDEKTFGKGFGEENDLCMRFAKHGLKNLALLNTYIIHLESQSFGNKQRINQIKNNYPKLLKKHPLYDQLVQKFIKQNPLKDIQNLVGYFQKNPNILNRENILIITHTNPYKIIGGVEVETTTLIQHINNKYPDKNVLLYFFDQLKNQHSLFILENNIVIKKISFNKEINSENILSWIIKSFKINLTIIEHLMYHSLSYGKILKENKIKFVLFIHDFYFYCPNSDLINDKNIFCKYEHKNKICENCLLNKLNAKVNILEWRKKSKEIINKYSDVVVFNSEFTKDKYLKLFNLKSNKKFKISYPE